MQTEEDVINPDALGDESDVPSGQAGEPAAKPGTGKDGGKDDANVSMSRQELEGLRRELTETRQAAQHWANVAMQRGGQQPKDEPASEPIEDLDEGQFLDEDAADGLDGDTPEKLVDDFAAKGVQALKSRGFITAADAQKLAISVAAKVSRELIARERGKITSETQIMSEFPELRDQNSPLFQKTSEFYKAAIAMDPRARTTPAALFLAAKAARAALGKQAPADNDDEPEADRRRRVDSQTGQTRSRGVLDDDDMLGDEVKQVIRQMGVSEDEFKAQRTPPRSSARPATRRR